MSPAARLVRQREWLTATAALQRVQCAVALRRVETHGAALSRAWHPWAAAAISLLPMIRALRRARRAGIVRFGLAWAMWRLARRSGRR